MAAKETYAEISGDQSNLQETARVHVGLPRDGYLWMQFSEFPYRQLHDGPAAQESALNIVNGIAKGGLSRRPFLQPSDGRRLVEDPISGGADKSPPCCRA